MLQLKKIIPFLLFLFSSLFVFSSPLDSISIIDGFSQAKKHTLIFNKPAIDFFEGALLGNGAMGVVINTRPDAVLLRFGHNNVWDIRLAENNKDKLMDFQSVFNKVKDIPKDLANLTDDAWYRQYNSMSAENYSKPYPRPFPCGTVLLGFDRRKMELIGHELDISNGLCMVKFLTSAKKTVFLKVFTAMEKDLLWMELVDEEGNPQPNLFDRIKLIPDPSTPGEFPHYQAIEKLSEGVLSFRQTLPYLEPDKYAPNPKDRAFSLTLKVNHPLNKTERINWNGNKEKMGKLEASVNDNKPFLASVSLKEGLDSEVQKEIPQTSTPTLSELLDTFEHNAKIWKSYWTKSAVKLDDQFLEEIWYRNLYFLNCATKDGVKCPGLFANWSYNRIGTAWHGDYHMNYNTQQPFWVAFSSNHLEKNLPYVNLIEDLMPVSKAWAKDYYGLPGAYFPHSAFPVDMTINPYPIPDWGWEVSETPWAVQGLWWQYLYSGDLKFLKERAYVPIKAAVEFLTAYMQRQEAHGGERWKDDKYHIFPSVPPELYGLRPGFQYNYDPAIDLTLTKFVFKAFKTSTKVLETEKKEKELLKAIDKILSKFPDYPTAQSSKYGKVLVSVPEEHSEIVYNVPGALFPVFPGEDFGLGSDSATLDILKNTYNNQRNEGGNDLVFINLQAARIGMLDLESFKKQVNYCLLPNGTATDMVMQTGGRYGDNSDFDFMAKMGIWFENFALPVVINECLLQGYNGTIRLFPNWPKEKDASFNDLRTAGAFLVSATQKDGKIKEVNILSEKGNNLRIILPWKNGALLKSKKGVVKIKGTVLDMDTNEGEKIILKPI